MEECSVSENPDMCHYALGITLNRTEACNLMVNGSERAMCLALALQDATYCSARTSPDICYIRVARRVGDDTICENIETDRTRDSCIQDLNPPSLEECDDGDPNTIDGIQYSRCIHKSKESYCSSSVNDCTKNPGRFSQVNGFPCEVWLEACN